MTSAVYKAYGRLLKEKTPHIIRNHTEYLEARNELRALMVENRLAPEEREYLELLATLLEAYERQNVKLRRSSPLEVLHELMDARNMKQTDLARLVGSSGTASEIYHGKREISKMLAKKLGKHFGVEYTLFL